MFRQRPDCRSLREYGEEVRLSRSRSPSCIVPVYIAIDRGRAREWPPVAFEALRALTYEQRSILFAIHVYTVEEAWHCTGILGRDLVSRRLSGALADRKLPTPISWNISLGRRDCRLSATS